VAVEEIRGPGAALLATLSHELRNPLQLMAHWVALLAATAHDPRIVADAVRGLEQALRRQAELADDLLEVSQLAAGQLPMTWTTFDLVALLRAGVDRHRPLAEQNRIALSFDAPAEPVLVAGDERRIRQMVDRLLGYLLAGAGPWVRVRMRAVDGRCEIHVDGSGDAAPAEDRRGGLGLVLARQLAAAHGGVMDVDDGGRGRGTSVRVHLPRAPDDDPLLQRAPHRLRGAEVLDGLRILVVDDDQTAREALAEALTAFGGRLAVAPSVAVALERLRGERFDAVCSDIEMPGDSGMVLARAVRAGEADGERQPLVAVTGLVGDDHDAAARRAGFDAFVAKPVDVDRLARRLRALVDAARAGQVERNSPTVASDGT
jgi:CheY-like chemotaxis protein